MKRIWLLMLALASAAPAWGAGCTRADVDHFLSRGFSTDQVVLLCGGDIDAAQSPQPDASMEAEQALRELLLRSVDANNLEVNAELLRWEQKVCVEYAPANLAGRPREICGPVTRELRRGEFVTGEQHRQVLIFGDHGVELVGPIRQHWGIDGSDLIPADQKRLQQRMQVEARSVILPLYPRADPAEVAAALDRWNTELP